MGRAPPARRFSAAYGVALDIKEKSMLRKLIMLAITSGVAKKLYDHYRRKQLKTPFPTSRPAEGRNRNRKSYSA